MNREQYENKLRASGCELLGSGLYSNVFAVPKSNKVIKVAEMDRWPEYILWATQNGYAGTFAPKVESLKFRDGYYIAVMERLVCSISDIRREFGYRSQAFHVRLYSEMEDWRYEVTKTAPCELLAFWRALRAEGLANDTHDGNVMVRHDGQLVITDPASGLSSGTKFRIKSGNCL